MKELSIEEKAKRYDEAIKRAKNHHDNDGLTLEQYETIDIIFPELKESEDERILKIIKETLKSYNSGIIFGSLSARDYADCLTWLEKQGEQKPADKVEPKFKIKYAGSEYNVLEVKDIAGVTYYGIEDEPNHIDYVQAENCERVDGYSIKESGSPFPTKPAKFSEQNSTWSEDDEVALGDALWCCKQAASIAKDENDMGNVWFAEHWLKSLKERVQPQLKQEWSEEDENHIKSILSTIECCKALFPNSQAVVEAHNADIEWLNSLRPQNWKPSEEQMKALSAINVTGGISYAGQGQELINLFSDLKKLRG